VCIDAVKNREQLPEPLVADLKAALGWAADSNDTLAKGLRVEDRWLVVGCTVQLRENSLSERRVWLHGHASGRRALILEYSHNGRGFETAWSTGQSIKTTLAFYPGSSAQRAIPCAPIEATEPLNWPGFSSELEWQTTANQLAENPFAPLSLLLLSPVACAKHDQIWWLHLLDGDSRRALPMDVAAEAAWDMFAITGGLESKVAGEWNGHIFRPICVVSPEGMLTFDRAPS